MKKTVIILLMAVLLAFQSCVDNSTTFPDDADGVFYGNLTVGDYTECVGISITENDNSTVDVFFDDVKFAKGMPLRIDIMVKGIPSSNNGDLLAFSTVNIDPYMNREKEPQPEYRFSEISGTVSGNELVLTARMSDALRPSFAGKKFSFRGVCE